MEQTAASAAADIAQTTETSNTAQPNQQLIHFANGGGAVKHRLPNLHHPRPPSAAAAVSYKNCLKNHAARLGGHAVDGCGEFLPSPSATPADPASLTCAVCGCHRNFHRREPIDVTAYPHPPPLLPPTSNRTRESPSPPPISPLLALSTGWPDDTARMTETTSPGGRKRIRTRFSQEQKRKMHDFAGRLGWKMPRGGRDERLMEDLCSEIGVVKGVFKVWMHNNKRSFGKHKQEGFLDSIIANGNGNTRSSCFDHPIHGSGGNGIHHHHHQHEDPNDQGSFRPRVSTNGSSSSS